MPSSPLLSLERFELARIRAAIANARAFRGLTIAAIEDLAQCVVQRKYPKGTFLAEAKQPAPSAFLLISGRVDLVADEGASVTNLSVLRTGDWFGDEAIFGHGEPAMAYVATQPTTALVLSRAHLLAHLERHPETSLVLIRDLARRLRSAQDRIVQLALSGVETRFVHRLVEVALDEGSPTQGGILLRRRPTQKELAQQIGTRRETVSRVYSRFVQRGLLVPRGQRLFIGAEFLALAHERTTSERARRSGRPRTSLS